MLACDLVIWEGDDGVPSNMLPSPNNMMTMGYSVTIV